MAQQEGTKSYRHIVDWDIDLSITDDCTRDLHSSLLVPAARAFRSNLHNVDGLMMSPFLIAADGIHRFYWAVKYAGACSRDIASMLRGVPIDFRSRDSEARRIRDASLGVGRFLETSNGVEEFAGQIGSAIEELMLREDFRVSIRTTQLSAVVLTWTAYAVLGHSVFSILKVHRIPRRELPVQDEATSEVLSRLREYRHLIVHRAAVIDKNFKKKTCTDQSEGELLAIDALTVAGFFIAVAGAGSKLLGNADTMIRNRALDV